jgi:quinol monooxygenase YgiN
MVRQAGPAGCDMDRGVDKLPLTSAEAVEVALGRLADNGLMTAVHLHGLLVCRNAQEAALVTTHLPRHVALTRAEDGCLSFDVTATGDPLVWRVDEVFQDAAAFRRHQERAGTSRWGRETAAIERRYVIEGL